MKYNDGFVAYLNGTQVASRNAPGNVSWNSSATDSRSDAQSLQPESINLSSHIGELQQGQNVLAVHGLNASAADPTFLVSAELVGIEMTAPELSLNEVAAASAAAGQFFVEIANNSSSPIDAGGAVISFSGGGQYVLPAMQIPANGLVSINEQQLGSRPSDGERVFFYAAGKGQMLDAHVVANRHRGASSQHEGRWLWPDVPTPGAANQFSFRDEIVINEIMYHAASQYETEQQPFASSDEEWIELYNRGAVPVDLGGWQLDDAVEFEFDPLTILNPGEFLVVARDASALLLKFPGRPIIGDLRGTLSNIDERILLRDSNGNTADEVHYYERGQWPEFGDGGGSSIELRDPDADNSRGGAWAASDESNRSSWQNYSYTKTVNAFPYDPPIHFQELVMGLLDEGEVLIDNVSVIESPGGANRQLIQNGSFQSDSIGGQASRWRIQGTHGPSRVIADPDQPGNRVLRLVATGKAHYMSNHAETTLANGAVVQNGRTYQISYDAKWITGSPQLHTELFHKDAARTTILAQPSVSGTPGAVNSVVEANIGPTYEGFGHSPVVPTSADSVVVSVVATDPDGIQSMDLKYRLNGAGSFVTVPMSAGANGLYTGTIPSRSNRSLVQFYVEGEDALGAVSTFPAAGGDSRALYRVDDAFRRDSLRHNVQILMTPSDASQLHVQTNMMHNFRYGSTLVYDGSEVFYDVGTRLKGSMFTRNSQSGTGYSVQFHPEQKFRGLHEVITFDQKNEQEIVVKHLTIQAGVLGAMYDDVVMLETPSGSGGGPTNMSMARHGDVFLSSQFENGEDGTMFKFEGIRVMTSTINGSPEGLKIYQPIGWVGNFDIANLGDDKEIYRWPFLILNNRDADDYTRIIDMGKAMSTGGAAFPDAVADVLDVDQWMQTFGMMSLAGIGDAYSQGNPHNLNFYVRPSDNKVLAFPWDWDFSFNQSTSRSIKGGKNVGRIENIPKYERLMYGHMLHAIDTVYNSTYMSRWSSHYGAMLAQNFGSQPGYMDQRAASVRGQINSDIPPVNFSITTNDPQVVNQSAATIQGRGWVDVREIRLAGSTEPLDVTWQTFGGDATLWEVTIPVPFGTNDYTFEAYDYGGQLIGSETIQVRSTVSNRPLEDFLRITEVMYNPTDPSDAEFQAGHTNNDDFEFTELVNNGPSALNLDGVRLTRDVTFDFSGSNVTSLPAGGRVVVVKDMDAFRMRYPGVPANVIAGAFASGGLGNGGDPLTLVDGVGTVLQDFRYDDEGTWPNRADGNGSSLEVIDTEGDYNDGLNWRNSSEYLGSPGTAGSGPQGSVVVNEVLTHTDLPVTDTIELHNTTGAPIDISGWFLSDDADNLVKYAIPNGTIIPSSGYVVFDEDDFNPSGGVDPQNNPNDFSLNSARGDDVWLVEGSGGRPVRFIDHVEFDAAANGESFGRWPNASGRLYPMISTTFGAANSGPRFGPVIISELMVHPTLPQLPFDDNDMEFVEIYNTSNSAVDLTNWELGKGVDYQFDAGTMLAAGEALVIISFEPDNPANAAKVAEFRSRYGIDDQVRLVGGYGGNLNDLGERVQLQRPDEPPLDEPSFIPMLVEDEIRFGTSAPWPAGVSGTGQSLTRLDDGVWTSDPTNWEAATPTPGTASFGPSCQAADLTCNGVVDFDDLTLLLANWNANVSAAQGNIVNPDTTPVNFDDLAALLAVWTVPAPGPSPAVAQAEPVETVGAIHDGETGPTATDAVFAELGSSARNGVARRSSLRTGEASSSQVSFQGLSAGHARRLRRLGPLED